MRIGYLFFAIVLCAASGLRASESYLIADELTGYVLASKDRDDKRQIASLTKIATAMVVLDWAKQQSVDLGTMVPVPAAAVKVGGVNPTGFQPGDEVSMRDLLYAALMASDNIAAHSVAAAVGRRLPNPKKLEPEQNFVAHMNGLADALKMTRTRFRNPSGLDNLEGSLPYSTAEDLTRLTRYAYRKPSFQFYVSQKSRDIRINRQGQMLTVTLQNTNPLLDQNGIDGVKTGRTAKAGDCIILSADRVAESKQEGDQLTVIPRRVIVVLLGVQDRSSEGVAMMRKAWQLHDAWVAGGRQITKSDTL